MDLIKKIMIMINSIIKITTNDENYPYGFNPVGY